LLQNAGDIADADLGGGRFGVARRLVDERLVALGEALIERIDSVATPAIGSNGKTIDPLKSSTLSFPVSAM
jgi:hypothetical protein